MKSKAKRLGDQAMDWDALSFTMSGPKSAPRVRERRHFHDAVLKGLCHMLHKGLIYFAASAS